MRNVASRKIWEGEQPNQFRGLDTENAIDLLLALNIVKSLSDLSPLKSVGLHKLKGDRKGQWAMTVMLAGASASSSGKAMLSMLKSPTIIRGKPMQPVVHPGRLLRREMISRNLSANRLALDLGVPSGRITDIINSRRSITADTAVRLGRYFGNAAQFWLDLQSQYDIGMVERERGKEIVERVRPAEVA